MPLYRAYGLVLDSELELPELPVTTSAAAILTIRLGKVVFDAPETSRVICRPVSVGEMNLFYRGVGTALVQDGSRITLNPWEGADGLAVRLFLLQQVLSIVLLQRGLVVLHSSSVIIDGKAISFVGRAGQGKSTMAATLSAMGYPALSDDVLAIEAGPDRGFMAQPGLTHLKLSEEAVAITGDKFIAGQTIRDRSNKKLCLMRGAGPVSPAPLGAIFLLTTGEGVEIQQAPPARGVIELIRQSYGAEVLPHVGRAASHFRQCADIARNVPIYVLSRQRDLSLVQAIAEKVIECVRRPLPS